MTEADRARQDSRKTMMLEAPLPSVIARMAVPSIVSFLITSIYNLADTYFVSSLGTEATAAVSVNASLDQIIMMAGSMLAVGASSYIARLLGARRDEEASRTLSSAFFLAMGFGGILNCFLDPLFIFYLDMEVKGASIATAISKLVSFAILIFPYVTGRSVLRLSLRRCRPTGVILGQIASVGSSSLFRNGLAVLSAIVLNNIAGGISDSALAGIGVSTKVMMFPFGIILGFGTGFQPVAGFNWGAGRYDRVLESYRFSARVAAAGAAAMGLALAVFAGPLIALFAEADSAMREIGALCIRLQCLALPVHSWVAVVNMLCAGLGQARGAVLLSTSRQGTCFLPIVYPVALLWGAVGVAAVQAVADILSMTLAVPIIRKVKRQILAAQRSAP